MRFFTPEESMKIFELAESPYRPKAIVDALEEIEAKTRLAEFRESITGELDHDLINEIVQLKLRTDALYADWVDGKIS